MSSCPPVVVSSTDHSAFEKGEPDQHMQECAECAEKDRQIWALQDSLQKADEWNDFVQQGREKKYKEQMAVSVALLGDTHAELDLAKCMIEKLNVKVKALKTELSEEKAASQLLRNELEAVSQKLLSLQKTRAAAAKKLNVKVTEVHEQKAASILLREELETMSHELQLLQTARAAETSEFNAKLKEVQEELSEEKAASDLLRDKFNEWPDTDDEFDTCGASAAAVILGQRVYS